MLSCRKLNTKERICTKVTALLLCLLSVASVCSCGETPQTDDTQSSAATSDESGAEETNSLPASIAALPKCDETTGMTVLTTVHAEYEFGKDELSGDVVNDAAEERNRVVEDLLNVKLNYVVKPGSLGGQGFVLQPDIDKRHGGRRRV